MNSIEIPIERPIINIGVISWDEFVKMVEDKILERVKDYDRTELICDLVREGFPKLTKDTVKSFLKEAFVYIKPQIIVDFGDNEFYWLVSGMDAILIHKLKS